MHDPLDFPLRPTLDSLRRKRRLAFFILLIENLSLSLWKPLFWALAFGGFWLIGIGEHLSPALNIALSLLFFIGFFFLFIRGVGRLKSPVPQDVDRRLELESAVSHRPLTIFEDHPVNSQDPGTQKLWQKAKTQTLEALKSLKIPAPKPLIARKDPFAFRLIAVLLIIAGAGVAGQDWPERLREGLLPLKAVFPHGLPKTITVTLTPPAYTGLAETVLTGPGRVNQTISLPIGTSLKAAARSGFGTPTLKIGDQSFPFRPLGEDNFAQEAKITQGNSLAVLRFGIPFLYVPIAIIPDEPPKISLPVADKISEAEPEESALPYTILPDHTVRFSLKVFDDYGVKEMSMKMDLDPMIEDAPLGKPIEEIRALTSPPKQEQATDPVFDFTASPWAGLPATITFMVGDHAGQTGSLEPISLTLPEREFRHPVSRALIAQRKALIWAPLNPPDDIVKTLEALLENPQDFQNDLIAFLGIKVASARLKYAKAYNTQNMESSWSVVDLLWDTALRIEDGNLSLAARNLRDAQRELENALRKGDMSKEEMMQHTDKIARLMEEYLSELQEELQKRFQNGENLPFVPPEMLTKSIDPQKLDSFMQQMLEEMMNGNPEKAQEMLSQLQKMLDSLNPSLAMPMPENMQQMDQGLNELQELIDRQEELLAQTQLQAKTQQDMNSLPENLGDAIPLDPRILQQLQQLDRQSGSEAIPPQPSFRIPKIPEPQTVNTEANKIEQEALRYVLGQLMLDAGEVFDEIPQNLGLAEMEMRDSADQLELNRPDSSIPHQEAAVKYLKEAQQQMQKEMMQKMQQMMAGAGGPMFFAMPSFGKKQLDPLGRPFSDGQEGDPNSFYAPVEIPDEAERRRVQELQKLLRDRSGELYRPPEELEYFRRLLKQF